MTKIVFSTAPEDQGQTVIVSFAIDPDRERYLMRRFDRSDRNETNFEADWSDDDPDFEPHNGAAWLHALDWSELTGESTTDTDPDPQTTYTDPGCATPTDTGPECAEPADVCAKVRFEPDRFIRYVTMSESSAWGFIGRENTLRVVDSGPADPQRYRPGARLFHVYPKRDTGTA